MGGILVQNLVFGNLAFGSQTLENQKAVGRVVFQPGRERFSLSLHVSILSSRAL